MFNTISWHSYWMAIAFTTAGYYLFVYLAYFRGWADFRALKRRNGDAALDRSFYLRSEKEQPPSLFDQKEMNQSALTEENEEHIVHACMDELNAFFDNQRKSKAIKPELMHGLYRIFQKYPSLRHSDFRESLSNVIATQCEDICSIHLSADELKGVWFG